uniref:helicase-related protein n=1 Tax=Alistipes communis TaxID=2585118 RepID=UPI00267032EE
SEMCIRDRINIAVSKPNEAIEQGAYVLYETQKLGLIKELFAKPLESKTIIFSSSKLKVKELAFAFKRMHLNAAAMHSDLDQAKREEVMLDFKNGKIDLLVATDIVARGIDIEDIGMVVNYDVPHDPEDYIHRIGRTARASATGRALTFVNEKEQGKFRRIEEFMEREVEKLPLPEKLGKAPAYEPSASGDRRGRGGRKGRGEAKGRGGRAGERPKAAPREAVPDSGAASPAIAGTEGVEGRNTERRRHRGGRHRRRGRKPAESARAVQGGGDASDGGGNA